MVYLWGGICRAPSHHITGLGSSWWGPSCGDRAGELLPLWCGRLRGINGWKHMEELWGGWIGKTLTARGSEGREQRVTDKGQKEGWQAQSPSVLWQLRKPGLDNAVCWSQSTSFQALLLLGPAHTPHCHFPFSCRPAQEVPLRGW